MTRRRPLLLAVLAAAALPACGGGSGSPGGPSGGGTASPLPGAAATINILAGGTEPKTVTVPVGSRVNFANQSGGNIEISSDPHPSHTECPPLNVGGLRAGQTGQTGAFTTARTCRYHDHGRPEDDRWQGAIVIQ
jgi:hypothetical protein